MKRPIVTLTTTPPRFSMLGPCLRSLHRQTLRPERIVLCIPDRFRAFPEWDGPLPKLPASVQILRSPRDYGGATMILPAARSFKNAGYPLVFCKDNQAYPPDWLERLAAGAEARGDHAIALEGRDIAGHQPGLRQPRAKPRPLVSDFRYRWGQSLAKRLPIPRLQGIKRRPFRASGYVDLFDARAGVLVWPEFFDERAFAIPNMMWEAEDIWLSGLLALREVPIWLAAGAAAPDPAWPEAAATALSDPARANAVAFMQKTYPIWR